MSSDEAKLALLMRKGNKGGLRSIIGNSLSNRMDRIHCLERQRSSFRNLLERHGRFRKDDEETRQALDQASPALLSLRHLQSRRPSF